MTRKSRDACVVVPATCEGPGMSGRVNVAPRWSRVHGVRSLASKGAIA